MFDAAGIFVGQIHHAKRVSNPSAEATMAVCGDCNNRYNADPQASAFFDAYQIRFQRWRKDPLATPLFSARKA